MKKNKMKNNKNRKYFLLYGLFVAGLGIFAVKFWSQQQFCVEYRANFTENFNSDTYKDKQNSSVANWPEGPISLSWLGSNFMVTEPAGMGAKIYVCDAGDFTGDGLPDLIGLDIANNYRLILVRNHFNDANGDGVDDDGIIFRIDTTEVYGTGFVVGPASITVADYNNDGLLDFFFYKNREDSFSYNQFVAAMFINRGTPTDPDFALYNQSPNINFTQKFMDAKIYCNWAADHLCSVDIDKDGDIDLLAISQDKIFLIKNPGVDPDSHQFQGDFLISELNYNQKTGFTVGRGGSSVDAADFDGDGDIDVIGGTVNNIPYLVYYENDGSGFFTRREIAIPRADCTGTVATGVADFNNDGRPDIFGATDRWNAGNEARMWFYKNMGNAKFEFRCLNDCQPILPPPHDVDMSACMDYDRDGDYDMILADANHSGDYYLIINELAPVYSLHGEAWSKVFTEGLNESLYAITKVQITQLRQSIRGRDAQGLAVEYYLSNNDGGDWEFYARFEGNDIKNYTNLPVHTFSHYGSRLKWKAILFAKEDKMDEYQGASFETPLIDEIAFEYTYVERREYSRTSLVATTILDQNNRYRNLIIGGTFYFPGWQGHLRAYDVSNIVPENNPHTVLRTVSRSDLSSTSGRTIEASGTEILWDAGEILQTRSASSRSIYTAVRPGPGQPLSRLDFTTANAATLGPILQDFNNNTEGLINFVRGEGREWKLGDIDHSNPIVVGPPEGTPGLMGDGYADFKDNYINRPKVLYVGANDGMLHCFDVSTGEELWGFIPYNLLPKLKNMWPVDAATGDRYFNRDVFVDGSPVAADVKIGGEWKTILICGQGAGKGSSIGGGLNYYFAIDITNPANPQPLWEFTDQYLGETWSVPVIGKVTVEGNPTWVAFMGSGYDNNPDLVVGTRFYAVRVDNGQAFWSFDAPDFDTSAEYPNIPNAIPGSPSLIDIDQNGFADRVYVADLDGRVWKINVSISFETKGKKNTTWDKAATVLYQDPHHYPIITKPVCWVNLLTGGSVPRVFFGTGGDDRAPTNTTYSFVALMDSQTPTVEWYLGDPLLLNLPQEKDKGDLILGEKVWANPVVSDFIVYFSTLRGNIENVDPCQNLAEEGKLYARYVQAVAGVAIGGTAFTNPVTGRSQESLSLASKARSAVTIGERENPLPGINKRAVYIQEYDSTIQRIEQPVGSLLKIKSWREIYKIVR